MKTPSPELYNLIQSLHHNEKRHFVLFAGMDRNSDSDKQYIQLFNALSKQTDYNEASARKDSGLTNPDSFKRIKNYTLEILLRSQENFHANSSVEVQLARRFIQVEILYRKKQIAIVNKCLAKATQLAKQHDKIFDLAKCYEWESRIANATGKPEKALTASFLENSRKIALQCSAFVELRELNNQLWLIIHEADSITPYYRKKLHVIIKETNALIKTTPAGFTISGEALSILAIAYRFVDRWDKSYQVRQAFLQLYESDPVLLNYYNAEYIVAIGNLINASREMKLHKVTDSLYLKARSYYQTLPASRKDLRLEERYLGLLNGYASYLFKQDQYESAFREAELLVPLLKKHNHTFQNSLESMLFQTLTVSALYLGLHRKSLSYFSKLTSIHHKWCFPLLGLCILYDSGNMDLLHYRARSLLYYQKKTGETQHDQLIRFFMTRLSKIAGRANEVKTFLGLRSQIQNLGKEDAGKLFGEMNYEAWIESKIASRTILSFLGSK